MGQGGNAGVPAALEQRYVVKVSPQLRQGEFPQLEARVVVTEQC